MRNLFKKKSKVEKKPIDYDAEVKSIEDIKSKINEKRKSVIDNKNHNELAAAIEFMLKRVTE